MEKINYANQEIINNISEQISKKKSGLIFKYNNETMVLKNNYHTLVIDEDDEQKNNKVIKPLIQQIIETEESLLINERSGNTYSYFKDILKEKGYETICIDMNNLENSNSYNILDLSFNLYKEGNKDKALEILENVGYYLLYDQCDRNSDPFWINSAVNLFVGCTLYLFENEKDITLNKIMEYVDKLRKEDIKEGTTEYTYLSGILMSPADTKGSILSVFKQRFNKYVSRKKISEILSKTSFNVKDITKGKMAIFVVEGVNEVSKNIASLIVNQIFNVCNIYGNSKKINIVLDDFDAIAPIKNIESNISLCDSLNVNITAFIKNFTSLNNVYGKETGDNLKIYFKNIVYLFSNDTVTLEYISKLCGSYEYMNDLRSIKENEALFILIRNNPFMVNI